MIFQWKWRFGMTKCTKTYIAHTDRQPDIVSRSKKQAGSRVRVYMFLNTGGRGRFPLSPLLGRLPHRSGYEHEIGMPKSHALNPSVQRSDGMREGVMIS